ncbi:hypothetical protein CEUSTIGMA_g3214.t1 [Chlamydomonas eustigma]|uniref:Lactate/malate dehydrogenase C-terminal domain-containing protein n=1 Tax=Chlamydomonas eustigma TaxID=1157962 RepID=A0A250WY68_9CHLO|nr:hypothetical protein CEUSTIGMA_g3214.t1 [Chlamydomonas eustigma]|eukprot:GAX75771.1 hypothetical protein CEUSTIGMA_g3214.t1 [Chlamydomonas eustigma]
MCESLVDLNSQVPDLLNACVEGQPALSTMEDHQWYKTEFVPSVVGRGLDVSKKWGRSSAPSTAIAIADAIRALVVPTAPGDCFSTAVCSDGNPYGVQEGLIFSFPCRSTGNGSYEICDGFVLDDWLASRITASQEELEKEKSSIMHLL